MRDSERELLEIIGSIYATIEAPESWPEVLRQLANLLRATAGTLNLYHLRSRRGEVAASFQVNPEFGRSYSEHFASKDVWINSPQAKRALGRVVLGQMLVADEELTRSEFYQEFLRPQHIFHLIGSRIQDHGDSTVVLSLFRPNNKIAFGTEETKFLECLLPHVLRAVQVFFRLSTVSEFKATVGDVLDHLPFGVILVTKSGRPVLANSTAVEIAKARDGLILRAERVEASSLRETACLHRLISEASASCSCLTVRPGGTIRLTRPSCGPALIVLVAPVLRNIKFFGEEGASAVLFITDPASNFLEVPEEILASLFGLTSAEARVCRFLVQGSSLDEVSLKLGVSQNTARTHLKHIFEKTGVHRQSELVLLFTRGFPTIREV